MAVSENRFYGNPCKKCNNTLRYKYRERCVTCENEYQKTHYRKRKSPSEFTDGRKNPKVKSWTVDPEVTTETSVPVIEGMPCRRCNSTIRFAKTRGCVRCQKQYYRDRARAGLSGPKKYASNAGRLVGITTIQYYEVCEDQDWSCKICKKPDNGRKLSVDHCHETMKFRGLLCYKCNSALGLFKDNIEYLQEAIEYLKNA